MAYIINDNLLKQRIRHRHDQIPTVLRNAPPSGEDTYATKSQPIVLARFRFDSTNAPTVHDWNVSTFGRPLFQWIIINGDSINILKIWMYSVFPNVSHTFLDEMHTYALDFWICVNIFVLPKINIWFKNNLKSVTNIWEHSARLIKL